MAPQLLTGLSHQRMSAVSGEGMESAMREKRAHRRYSLQLPVRYKSLKGSGVGLTQNLSSAGVAFFSDSAIDIGSVIEVWVSWPAGGPGKTPLELRMTGRVVRSRDGETAVHVRRHDFVDARSEDITGRATS